jgi:hypothetical protein
MITLKESKVCFLFKRFNLTNNKQILRSKKLAKEGSEDIMQEQTRDIV